MKGLKGLFEYIFFAADNMAGTIVFYSAYRLFGAKPAIAFAVATCIAQLIHHQVKKFPVSPLFYLVNGMIISLGTVDLCLATPRFLKFEPAISVFIPAMIGIGSALISKPLAGPIMESMPGIFKLLPGEADHAYLVKVTWIMSVLALLKAAICFYLAFHVDLGSLWLIRKAISIVISVVGFGGELLYRKVIKNPGSSRETLPG